MSAGWLYRGLAVAVGILLAFHALACGAFFCFRFSVVPEISREIRDDIRDIYAVAGEAVLPMRRSNPAENASMIHNLIHQTYKSSSVPSQVLPLMQSWRRHNPDWQVRFYDDAACLSFVRQEFPEYLDAYRALPKNVERSDFFRYMVVLRHGGTYADMDVECRKPLSQVFQPHDTLVVSWENEFATAEQAGRRQYVRQRQILQWVFAAAPGHPVLRAMCDHIAMHATQRLAVQDSFDTLLRTGPGMWTDLILEHARLHPPAAGGPWGVRILPMVVFGSHPSASDSVLPTDPSVAALHWFLGSWKDRGLRILAPSAMRRLVVVGWNKLYPELGPASLHEDGERHLYPVSVAFQPVFSILVDLAGHGELQAGEDVNAYLTKFGKWQPSLHHSRAPSVLDALVGSLGGQGAYGRRLLDVGAGPGLFSLAAAARGHRVTAFELGPASSSAFQASIAFNGFEDRMQLHKAALGHAPSEICVSASSSAAVNSQGGFIRGYGQPLHHEPSQQCNATARRHLADSFVVPGSEVGAVRISAPGWEGWILQGMQAMLTGEHPPGAILLELYPDALEQYGFPGGAVALLEHLYVLGYTDISHSGHVCDERWHNVTRTVKQQAAAGLPPPETLSQPTWCHLRRDRFSGVTQRVPPGRPENVLLTRQAPVRPAEQQDRGLPAAGQMQAPAVGGAAGGEGSQLGHGRQQLGRAADQQGLAASESPRSLPAQTGPQISRKHLS